MTSIAVQRPNPRKALALSSPVLIAGAVLLALALAALIGQASPTAPDPVAGARPEPRTAAPGSPPAAPSARAGPVTAAASTAASAPNLPRRGAHVRSTSPRRVHVAPPPRAAQAGRREEPAQDPLLDDAAAAGMTSRARPPEGPQ